MNPETIVLAAELDQIDAMLRDAAEAIHEVVSKPSSKWSQEDWMLVTFILHAGAARALYLKGKEVNEDN